MAALDAADQIESQVRRFLEDNYNASDIMTRTGTLLDAIRKTKVRATVDGNRVKLSMNMPRDPKAHKGQTEGEFFQMAGALNFGSVRMPQSTKKVRAVVDTVTGAITGYRRMDPLGGKVKRAIKKYAMTGKMHARTKSRLADGTTIGGKYYEGYDLGTTFWTNLNKNMKPKSVKFSGGTIVTMPHPFFYLKPSQERAIGKLFAAAFLEAYQATKHHSASRR